MLWNEGWHRGVIGIVASRIVERYHRPTILVALEGNLVGHGSGRSIPGFDLLAALRVAVSGDLATLETEPLVASALAGIFNAVTAERVNLVNARLVAE